MKTSPLTKYSILSSVAFFSARLSSFHRIRKQEPSQMQLAFERARVKAS